MGYVKETMTRAGHTVGLLFSNSVDLCRFDLRHWEMLRRVWRPRPRPPRWQQGHQEANADDEQTVLVSYQASMGEQQMVVCETFVEQKTAQSHAKRHSNTAVHVMEP